MGIKTRQGLGIFVVIALPLSILMAAAIILLPNLARGGQESSVQKVQEYPGSWEYRYGDSPRAADGSFVWAQAQYHDGGWQTTRILEDAPGRHGARFLWMRTRLEGPQLADPALFMVAIDQSYEAYLDGKLIDHFGPMEGTHYPGLPTVLLPLGAAYVGKALVLRIYSPYRFIGIFLRPQIGDHRALFDKISTEGLAPLLSGCLQVFLGCTALILFVMYRRERAYLYYAGFAIGAGVQIVGRSYTHDLLLDFEPMWTYLEFSGTVIGCASMCLFVAQVFVSGPFRLVRRLGQLMLAILPIGIVLVGTGVVHIWSMLLPEQLFLLLAVACMVPTIISAVKINDREGQILGLGFIVGISIICVEVLMIIGVLPRWRYTVGYHISTVLTLMFGVLLALRFARTHRRLQNYTTVLQHSLALADVLEPGQQARAALDELVRMLDSRRALLFQTDEESGQLILRAGRDDKGADILNWRGFDADVVEQVRATRKPVVVHRSSRETPEPRSIMAVPLLLREKMLGVLYLETEGTRRIFQKEDREILLGLGSQIASALVSTRAMQLEFERALANHRLGEQGALLEAAARMAKGDLDAPIVVSEKSDLASLASALDGMRQDLSAKVHQLVTRNQEVQQLNEELRRQIEQRSRRLLDMVLPKDGRLPVAAKLSPGMLLGDHYRVVHVLGEGGMGIVYEVERTTDRQRLAAKVLTSSPDRTAIGRFAREAQILARLNHRNLISITDIDVTSQGVIYIVMELVKGSSLWQLRAEFGQKDVSWGLCVLRQLADALAVLHSQGVVHRDRWQFDSDCSWFGGI